MAEAFGLIRRLTATPWSNSRSGREKRTFQKPGRHISSKEAVKVRAKSLLRYKVNPILRADDMARRKQPTHPKLSIGIRPDCVLERDSFIGIPTSECFSRPHLLKRRKGARGEAPQ
jgi:hypothetical protein